MACIDGEMLLPPQDIIYIYSIIYFYQIVVNRIYMMNDHNTFFHYLS